MALVVAILILFRFAMLIATTFHPSLAAQVLAAVLSISVTAYLYLRHRRAVARKKTSYFSRSLAIPVWLFVPLVGAFGYFMLAYAGFALLSPVLADPQVRKAVVVVVVVDAHYNNGISRRGRSRGEGCTHLAADVHVDTGRVIRMAQCVGRRGGIPAARKSVVWVHTLESFLGVTTVGIQMPKHP
ncbi:hypothetical protein [Pseudoxanthomonas sp. PXM02]|uniref:hypothetical protein n=1 Tax=Pseudoxanthomonas sp. PXM02 TaxID=2769294 RepID=UPI00178513AC|nr:hypothetical protein [Pseudoxanthomonas sp. PXM02]MBD9480658.1 hypothetical protein [Pseudoxanthomonas sp. PXM02]